MARTILAAGAVMWLLASAVALLVAVAGREWLLDRLPPLAIGADALGGAVLAFAMGLLAVALVHGVTLFGLRTCARWGRSAAILLAGVLVMFLATLAVAGVTSAISHPPDAPGLLAASAVALIGAAGYGLAAGHLVRELRAESAS